MFHSIKIFLLFFLLPFQMLSLFAQNDAVAPRNLLFLNVGYPFPASAVSFSNNYRGILEMRLGFERGIKKRFTAGITTELSFFQIDPKVLDIKTTMQLITPAVIAGWRVVVLKKICLHSHLSAGYTFISFKGTDIDGNKRGYSQSGFAIQPSFTGSFSLSSKIDFGITGCYKIIFQHFGNKDALEDNSIRTINAGVYVSYKL